MNRLQPLDAQQDIEQFECTEKTLNFWLKQRALKNEGRSSRTFVLLEDNNNKRVIGYFCLSTGSVEHKSSPGSVKRNMPNPIPVCVLGRLAVDRNVEGQGIGSFLLKQSIIKTIAISKLIGVRALLVHAISDQAKSFYLKYGFRNSDTHKLTLLLTVSDAIKAMNSE